MIDINFIIIIIFFFVCLCVDEWCDDDALHIVGDRFTQIIYYTPPWQNEIHEIGLLERPAHNFASAWNP